MVCSDGLTKELGPVQIEHVLREEAPPQAAATRLVHESLLHGGRDNITVVVVDVVEALAASDDDTAGATAPRALPEGEGA